MIRRKNALGDGACPQGSVLPLYGCVLVFGTLLAVPGVVFADACILPDNGSGTVSLPLECNQGFVAPESFFTILPDMSPNGLPEGSSIQVAVRLRNFTNIVRTPGGVLFGEKEMFNADVLVDMRGTGPLAGFQHSTIFPAAVETDVGLIPFNVLIQEIPAEMRKLDGQTFFFDSVFSLFRIRAGAGLEPSIGLPPSPGGVKLVLIGEGVCQGGVNDGRSCASDVNCPDDDINGTCVGGDQDGQPCNTQFDCGQDGECVNPGQCVCPPLPNNPAIQGCGVCVEDATGQAGEPCDTDNDCLAGESCLNPAYYARSFFDVNYQIDFQAKPCPGSPVCGLSGTSTGTVRIQTGAFPIAFMRPNGQVNSREISFDVGDTTCDGGPNDGQPCSSDADCPDGVTSGVCDGGLHNGQECVVDDDCATFGTCIDVCNGGVNDGDPCSDDTDCSNLGLCDIVNEVCTAGVNEGEPCTVDSDCPSLCDARACLGGINDGSFCTDDASCTQLAPCVGNPDPGKCGFIIPIECFVRDFIPTEIAAYQVTLPQNATPLGTTLGSVTHNGRAPGLDTTRADYLFASVGTCNGGPNDGEACTRMGDCTGGVNDGEPCFSETDCPNGTCDNIDDDCPGGTCNELNFIASTFVQSGRPVIVVFSLGSSDFPYPVVEKRRYVGDVTFIGSPDARGDFEIPFFQPGVGSSASTSFDDRNLGPPGIAFSDFGVIVHFPPVPPCDDADCAPLTDDCNEGRCNDLGECEAFPFNEGGACDDQDPCTDADVCVNGTCIGMPQDTDGDGVLDCNDNCICTFNPSQCDSDGDGFGNHCDADLNNDGVVGIPDFGPFRACFGSMDGDANFDPACDFNCDGAVGIPDFSIFRSGFGLPPGSDCPAASSQSVRQLPAGISLKDLKRGLEKRGRTNR